LIRREFSVYSFALPIHRRPVRDQWRLGGDFRKRKQALFRRDFFFANNGHLKFTLPGSGVGGATASRLSSGTTNKQLPGIFSLTHSYILWARILVKPSHLFGYHSDVSAHLRISPKCVFSYTDIGAHCPRPFDDTLPVNRTECCVTERGSRLVENGTGNSDRPEHLHGFRILSPTKRGRHGLSGLGPG